MLTGNEVWHDTDTKKAQKNIRRGKLPKIADKFLNSTDAVHVALRDAISMCYVFDPKERAAAAEVATFLQEKYDRLPGDYVDS